MFSLHTARAPEEFKNAPITGHFGFVFEENSVREITWLSWRHPFRKASYSKVFRSHEKFSNPPFWGVFSKALFFRRISVDVRPNRRNQRAALWKKCLLWRAFPKALFFGRICVDGRPNCRNKRAALWNFFFEERFRKLCSSDGLV